MRSVPRDLLIVLLVAVSVRIAFVVETHGDAMFSLLVLDARSYFDLASRFAGGDWLYGHDPLWFPPLYPTLLGILFRAVGPHPEWAIALQHLLGVGTAVLGAVLGRRISRGAGLVAGLALAVHPVPLFYESQLLYTSLAIFLTAAFLLRFVVGTESRRAAPAAWAGLLLGLLGLTRSNSLLFLPFGAIVLARTSGRRATGAFAATALLVLVPVLLRNGLVAGAWTPLTVNGGMIFATGFNEESLGGRALQRRPEDFGPQGAYQLEAERALGRPVSLAEASDWHRARALAWIREHPGDALRLTLRKAGLIATSREIDDNLSLPVVAGKARTLDWLPGPWAWLFIPAVIGAAAMLRARGSPGRTVQIVALYSAVYCGSLLLFFVNSRYRLPIVAPLAVLGGAAVARLGPALRSGRWRTVAGPLLAGGLVAWPVLRDPGVEADPVLGWVAVGAAMERAGLHEQALALSDRAIAERPDIAGAWQNRAVSLLSLGRPDDALAAAREATRLDPDLGAAWKTLGAILARGGKVEEALPAFQRAAELLPEDPGALANLARALALTGRREEAVAVGRRAVAAGAQDLAPLVREWAGAGLGAQAPGSDGR